MMSSKARALIVDDDNAIRFMVGKILEREGFDVEEARDGKEAIEKIKDCDYAMILLDLMMPRTDGFYVLKSLAEVCPEQLARVVVMSALPSDYLPKPIPFVIPKPFDIERLTRYAREFLIAHDVAAAAQQIAG
jgi:DNA-binding response OmpR family regulator